MYFTNKEIISKELMSKVLNLNITYIERYNNSIIYKISVYDREEEINIYELAHKCKEWAILNHYDFTILIDTVVIYNEGIQIYTIYNTLEDDNFIPFDPIYEIKACQWILDNKDK